MSSGTNHPLFKPLSLKQKKERFASSAAKEKARQVKKIYDTSPDQIPTIAALASELHSNRICLQTAFQELFSVSIAVYGRQVKIQRIKELLLDFTLTLDTIAEQTGYNGGPALSRFFKQMEGVSPGRWRRNQS
jgi:two-component system, response regulator YesN